MENFVGAKQICSADGFKQFADAVNFYLPDLLFFYL